MYQCILVKNGYEKENFFRDDESAQDVLESLQNFDYGSGEWRIYENDVLEAAGEA